MSDGMVWSSNGFNRIAKENESKRQAQRRISIKGKSQESKEEKCILENERELREIFIGQETEATEILLSSAKWVLFERQTEMHCI